MTRTWLTWAALSIVVAVGGGRIAMTNAEVVRVMQMLWPWLSEPKREQMCAAAKRMDEQP